MNIIEGLGARLDVLVPDFKHKFLRGNDLDTLIWDDARPQPPEGAIRAVSQAQMDAKAADRRASRVANPSGDLGRLDFQVKFDQENRLRALENKPPVNEAQYRATLKTIFRNL